jgi:hypothetical protein
VAGGKWAMLRSCELRRASEWLVCRAGTVNDLPAARPGARGGGKVCDHSRPTVGGESGVREGVNTIPAERGGLGQPLNTGHP